MYKKKIWSEYRRIYFYFIVFGVGLRGAWLNKKNSTFTPCLKLLLPKPELRKFYNPHDQAWSTNPLRSEVVKIHSILFQLLHILLRAIRFRRLQWFFFSNKLIPNIYNSLYLIFKRIKPKSKRTIISYYRSFKTWHNLLF